MAFDFDSDMNLDMKQILSIQKQSQKSEFINKTSTTISNFLTKLSTISKHREFSSKKTEQIMKNLTAKQKKIKIIMIKMSKSTTSSVSYEKFSRFESYKSINQLESGGVFESKIQFFFELFQKKSNTIKNTNLDSVILSDSKLVSVERTQPTAKALTRARNLHAEKKRFFTKFDFISKISSKINDEN